MERSEFDEAIIGNLEREPFRPFAVTQGDGQVVTVDRRNAIAFRSGKAIFIEAGPKIHFWDHDIVTKIER